VCYLIRTTHELTTLVAPSVAPRCASHYSSRPSERSAARLAHQSGGLGVPSSNLGAPTTKTPDFIGFPSGQRAGVGAQKPNEKRQNPYIGDEKSRTNSRTWSQRAQFVPPDTMALARTGHLMSGDRAPAVRRGDRPPAGVPCLSPECVPKQPAANGPPRGAALLKTLVSIASAATPGAGVSAARTAAIAAAVVAWRICIDIASFCNATRFCGATALRR
jgi:hypothetical protein